MVSNMLIQICNNGHDFLQICDKHRLLIQPKGSLKVTFLIFCNSILWGVYCFEISLEPYFLSYKDFVGARFLNFSVNNRLKIIQT